MFGHKSSVAYARTEGGSGYPSGAVLSTVTWTQEEDSRWFGVQIPGQPKSVEFVTAHLGFDGGTT